MRRGFFWPESHPKLPGYDRCSYLHSFQVYHGPFHGFLDGWVVVWNWKRAGLFTQSDLLMKSLHDLRFVLLYICLYFWQLPELEPVFPIRRLRGKGPTRSSKILPWLLLVNLGIACTVLWLLLLGNLSLIWMRDHNNDARKCWQRYCSRHYAAFRHCSHFYLNVSDHTTRGLLLRFFDTATRGGQAASKVTLIRF